MMDLVARPNWVLRGLVKNPMVIAYERSFFVEIRAGWAEMTHWQDALRTSATSRKYNRTRLAKNYINILSLFRFFTGPRTPLLLIQASLSFVLQNVGKDFQRQVRFLWQRRTGKVSKVEKKFKSKWFQSFLSKSTALTMAAIWWCCRVSVNMAQVHQLEPEEATPNLGEGKQS